MTWELAYLRAGWARQTDGAGCGGGWRVASALTVYERPSMRGPLAPVSMTSAFPCGTVVSAARCSNERHWGASRRRGRVLFDHKSRGIRSSGQVRHVRMLGLCLVAVFAVCAYAVSSASALPEWGKCEAKAGGNYSDSNCTVKAKPKGSGSFEWKKGKELPNVKFTGANKEAGHGGVLTGTIRICWVGETDKSPTTRAKCAEEGGREVEESLPPVECESETNTGEQSGTNAVQKVFVTFRGCGVINKALPCKSNGAAAEEIKVNELKGKLGYINKGARAVGVLLEPAKHHGAFAEFECGGLLALKVGVGNSKEGAYYQPEKTGGYDGIISPIGPVNKMTSTFEQVYTVNPTTHENEPSKFEGKHIELLENLITVIGEPGQPKSDWSQAGEEITNVNTPEVEGEIKA